MTNEFCTYEQALALKELGFDKPCFSYYNPNGVFMWKIMCSDEDNDHTLSIKDIMEHKAEGYVECPLKQQAFKFFREKHGSHSHISKYKDNNFYHYDIFVDEVDEDGDECYETYPCNDLYNTYEEAEEACLDKLIEIAKNKKL
jgi:hypothetical protein